MSTDQTIPFASFRATAAKLYDPFVVYGFEVCLDFVRTRHGWRPSFRVGCWSRYLWLGWFYEGEG